MRRLRTIEASYRHWIKRALDEAKDDTVDHERSQRRYERVRTKYTRKIDRLQSKIRALATRRSELKNS